jgi:hypothetical protein
VEGRISPGNQRTLFQRASFDLGCPADQVHLTRFAGQTVGARGCGHKAVYVWVQRSAYVGEWILENVTDYGGIAPDERAEGSHAAIPDEPRSSDTPGSDGATSAERRQRAIDAAKNAPPWSCFEGTIGGLPTGWCAGGHDECTGEARAFAEMDGAKLMRDCQPQPLAACIAATSVLQAKRQVDCFATFAACEAYRTRVLSSSDHSDVSDCESAPTSWITPAGDASSDTGLAR